MRGHIFIYDTGKPASDKSPAVEAAAKEHAAQCELRLNKRRKEDKSNERKER